MAKRIDSNHKPHSFDHGHRPIPSNLKAMKNVVGQIAYGVIGKKKWPQIPMCHQVSSKGMAGRKIVQATKNPLSLLKRYPH